ncbi:MAG: hypothetical protein JXR51_00480 [Bacteroidales bacterium]|nr:hypothetical protein [Bacteroidales bacterium]MBN2755616.1 hypothetical protein [Bacteroidales bacterium]
MYKFILIFILCTTSLKAQLAENPLLQKAAINYWFFIELEKIPNQNSGAVQIHIKNIYDNIISGTFDEFDKDHQRGMIRSKIIIGPFSEKHQAENSMSLYKNVSRGILQKGSEQKENDITYSFFYVSPYSGDSIKGIYLEPIPSRVSTGSQEDFIASLDVGLNFEKLAIGPFPNYKSAEKAKFVYRKNVFDASYVNNEKNESLKRMVRKWKSLKFEIVRKAQGHEADKFRYRFSTGFPQNYFEPDAVQVIIITANYNDKVHTSRTCFSLQGSDVLDNNYSISSERSTTYVNFLFFDKYNPARITGFLFESFIYNDAEMIDLEPVFIDLK